MKHETQKHIIGVLGMPDNERTKKLLEFLVLEKLSVDFIVYWKPGIKDNYKRFRRKLRTSGFVPTILRIYYATVKSKSIKQNQKVSKEPIREYFVPSHNSVECLQILEKEKVDVLLLATDAIIKHKILKIPRLATLNAHPGWIPRFRGLGSTYYQLANGKLPSVSIHQVDEGVDTGPLILREYLNVDPTRGLRFIDNQVNLLQYKLMSKAVKMFEEECVEFIDTFHEPSNMNRGMPVKIRKLLDKELRSGKLKLYPPNT